MLNQLKNKLKNQLKNNLNDCNWTRTQYHLVHQRTLNRLAKLASLASLTKWLSVRLRTKWFWVRVQLQSLKLQISHLLRVRSSLTFRQVESVDSLWNAYVTRQEHTVKKWLIDDLSKRLLGLESNHSIVIKMDFQKRYCH